MPESDHASDCIILPHRRLLHAFCPWSDHRNARPLLDVSRLWTEALQQGIITSATCLFVSAAASRSAGRNLNPLDLYGRRHTGRSDFRMFMCMIEGDFHVEVKLLPHCRDGLVVLTTPLRRGIAMKV